jgi:hypothetical protein
MDELVSLRRTLMNILKEEYEERTESSKIKGDQNGNVTVSAKNLEETHELLIYSQDATASLNILVKELILKLSQKKLLNVEDIVPIHKLSSDLNISRVKGLTSFELSVPLHFPNRSPRKQAPTSPSCV